MSIVREKILYDNQDKFIKISLSNKTRFTGYQQEIDKITNETKNSLINPIIDEEVTLLKFAGSSVGMNFYFNSTTSYSYEDIGFTEFELINKDKSFLNSFFIFDMYDSFDVNTQSRIFRNYLTKLYDDALTSNIPKPAYLFDADKPFQLNDCYIPNAFLKGKTGLIDMYVKFSFFNAKNGILYPFYNPKITDEYSPERMYFKARLDIEDREWRLLLGLQNKAYNLPLSSEYVNKVNESIDKLKLLKQKFPTGNSFDVNNADYFTV